jgi:nucleoside-diphosphate-sugar epimerase
LKKLIIIGSSGFVGKSLNDYFKNKGDIKIINYSRTEKKNIIRIKKLPVSDYIIYCINNPNIKLSLKYFYHFKKLLKRSSKKVKIVFFSSGAIYGPRSTQRKFRETEKIYKSKHNKFSGYKKKYSKEKYILEKEFKKITKEGFKVSIARGFAFYGKYILNYDYLISKIILAVKSKKSIKINNPNIKRSYMHSDDMCRWLIKIANFSSTNCPVINLGSDKILNLTKFINYLNKKFKSNITINKNNIKKIDFYVPSINFAKKTLKLKNTVNFNNAINYLIKIK